MEKNNTVAAFVVGAFFVVGMTLLGSNVHQALLEVKSLDRTVTVKGLAEREVKANIAIWPIKFIEVDNDLARLHTTIQTKTDYVIQFLKKQGFDDAEITVALPTIEDRQAQGYVDPNVKYRYSAKVILSLYTTQVDRLLTSRAQMIALVKDGIAISSQDYDSRTEFLYTDLNTIKPSMIQEATQNAREVALKFAKDSDSKLGKIKQASQGQFAISDRDSSTPHIKQVRIVSTLTYYLND